MYYIYIYIFIHVWQVKWLNTHSADCFNHFAPCPRRSFLLFLRQCFILSLEASKEPGDVVRSLVTAGG